LSPGVSLDSSSLVTLTAPSESSIVEPTNGIGICGVDENSSSKVGFYVSSQFYEALREEFIPNNSTASHKLFGAREVRDLQSAGLGIAASSAVLPKTVLLPFVLRVKI
jgi:hypothetical protein